MESVRTRDVERQLAALAALLARRRVAVLTGAGCSTESGIPDYRGAGRPRRSTPLLYQVFLRDPAARRRYWARSLVGWPRVAKARPNAAHRALARLEREGLVRGLVTQNVDGLHGAAGSRRVVELHGDLARVRCVGCDRRESRAAVQRRLLALNPGFGPAPAARIRAAPDGDAAEVHEAAEGRAPDVRAAPDGDAEIDEGALASFRTVSCRRCGGVLKPDVVFFGENVPRERVEAARRVVDRADALLVVGSSLAVHSGFRFVRQARANGVPVAIVNLGATRGDALARLRVEGRAGRVLPAVADRLLGTGAFGWRPRLSGEAPAVDGPGRASRS